MNNDSPVNIDECIALAYEYHCSGKLQEAKELYEYSLTLDVYHIDALHLYGTLLLSEKAYEQALVYFDRALSLLPHPVCFFNRGLCLNELGRYEDALIDYREAIELNPLYIDAWYNAGNTLLTLERYEDAILYYDKVLALNRHDAKAYTNKGCALAELHRYDEALICYDRAININPYYGESYWNKALALLMNGDLREGFRLYEWRHKNKALQLYDGRYTVPAWQGEELSGKTILVHSEQGFGDTIQFCRYIPYLIASGAHVVIEVEAVLISLLKQFLPLCSFIKKGEMLAQYAYHIPFLSLADIYKTTQETIPLKNGYLSSDTQKKATWIKRLSPYRDKLKIGLVWSGNESHRNDKRRSIALSELARFLPENAYYICLQKEIRASDMQTLRANQHIYFFGDELYDFSDTAALCDCVDIVIGVDTAVIHLAGALAKPTWVLLSYRHDWRWMKQGEKSPWYSSMHLFRQENNDATWSSVLTRVHDSLCRYISHKE